MNKIPYTNVGPEEAQKLIGQGRVKVVDVRRPEELKTGQIENATMVTITGFYDFSENLKAQNIPQDQPVLFVCEMGQRSAAASEVAAVMGYKEIYNLEGGMNFWRHSGMEVVRPGR